MNFELSEEQIIIRDSVNRFGANRYDPAERLRPLTVDGGVDRARWRDMAELGLLALPLAESHGGLGGSAVDVMVVMEAFGRHLMLEPYVTSCILALPLLMAGKGEVIEGVIAGIVEGRTQVATAIAEVDAGFDLRHVATVAEKCDGGVRLSGTKTYVENGADADWFILPARTEGACDAHDGVSLFIVERNAPGIRIERFRGIDHRRHARLQLDGVEIDETALLGPLNGGGDLLEFAVDRAITAHLAEALGSMEALRDMTLEYLKTRQQFGVAIGSFQALQHRMVDIAIACEEARSMTYHATLRLEADPGTRRKAVSAAKARVGQTALYVGRQAVQLHGGVGVSDELIVSHHLKRLMMIDLSYGNADYHRTRFADGS